MASSSAVLSKRLVRELRLLPRELYDAATPLPSPDLHKYALTFAYLNSDSMHHINAELDPENPRHLKVDIAGPSASPYQGVLTPSRR